MNAAHLLDRPRPHTVAIVAMGASSSDYINLASQHGGRSAIADEVWAINAMGNVIEHDAVFAMDDMSELRYDAGQYGKKVASSMLEWLPTHPGPIFVPRVYPEIPGAVEYPLVDVINSIGFPYLNNSVAYAVAYGIHLGVKRMALYGCDFSYRESNVGEEGRGCVEWLLGLAGARGINIQLSATTTLMDADLPPGKRLYGYDETAIPEQYCPGCQGMEPCDCGIEPKWRVRFPDRGEDGKARTGPRIIGG